MVDHCYLACSFLPKVLQRGVAEVVFPPQMLHTADQPGLNPLRRWPRHALWRRPCVLLDTFPQPLPDGAAGVDESRARANAGLPASRSTPSSSYSSRVGINGGMNFRRMH